MEVMIGRTHDAKDVNSSELIDFWRSLGQFKGFTLRPFYTFFPNLVSSGDQQQTYSFFHGLSFEPKSSLIDSLCIKL